MSNRFAIDLETLDDGTPIIGCVLDVANDIVVVTDRPMSDLIPWVEGKSALSLQDADSGVPRTIRRLRATDEIVAHNSIADFGWMRTIPVCPIVDTLGLWWLIDENMSHRLKDLARRFTPYRPWDRITKRAGRLRFEMDNGIWLPMALAGDDLVRYCALDCRCAAAIADVALRRLPFRLKEWYWATEEPFLRACIAMSTYGVHIDIGRLSDHMSDARYRLSEAKAELDDIVGWELNVSSPTQVKDYLTKPTVKAIVTYPHVYSTGRTVMRKRADVHPGLGYDRIPDTRASTLQDAATDYPELASTIDAIMMVRDWRRIIGSYLEPWAESTDGIIHATFSPFATVTGRTTTKNPNLATIPVRRESGVHVKSLITARPGNTLIWADYSSLEMAIMHWLSGAQWDPTKDYHTGFAELAAIDRIHAKTTTYGILYGGGKERIQSINMCSPQRADEIRVAFEHYYPEASAWMRRTADEVRSTGQIVMPLSGRVRHCPAATRLGPAGARAARQAVNSVNQGTGADLLKRAVSSLGEFGQYTTLTVYDSIMQDVPSDLIDAASDALVRAMTDVAPFRVGVDLSTGQAYCAPPPSIRRGWAAAEPPTPPPPPTRAEQAKPASPQWHQAPLGAT